MAHCTTPATRLRFTLAAWLAFGVAGCAAKAAEKPVTRQLEGTWELVSIHTRWPDGRVTEPWGAAPVGRLSYGADARMSALLMDAGRNQADGHDVPPDLLPHVASYYGTYSVDTSRRIVMHRVTASLRVNESGILERSYEMRGDTLILTADAIFQGAAVTHTLRWRRMGTP